MIDHIESHVVYENPQPMLRSRHGYFPGLVQLASGELLALLVIGEAFESVDLTTHVARSSDDGRTWTLQGPLLDKSRDSRPTSDFLKPLVLRDGSLIALGYRFHRDDPEQTIAIQETDGALPGDDIVASSTDDGRTWSAARIIPRRTPELLEIPSRSVQLASGDIVATAGLFTMPDGSRPSGQFGPLLRSTDGGQTWDDGVRYFDSPQHSIAAYESHVCEMQPGRLVAICWAFDIAAGRYLSNQVTVSHDDGHTWSAPIDTGHQAESANLLYLGGERLLSIHCHRGADVGLVVRRHRLHRGSLDADRGTHDLGRLDAAADARRADVLRVRPRDPVRPGLAPAVAQRGHPGHALVRRRRPGPGPDAPLAGHTGLILSRRPAGAPDRRDPPWTPPIRAKARPT